MRAGLANWRGIVGDAAGASAALKELLRDDLKLLGPDHPDTLTTRASLARWQGEAGDAEGASAALKELLIEQSRVLGSSHPDTLATQRSLDILT